MTSNQTDTNPAARPRPNLTSLAGPRRQSGLFSRQLTGYASTPTTLDPSEQLLVMGLPTELLEQVYETNHIDCVMQHAEVQATLNDVCAIQVKCTNDPDKPVDLQLWGGDEFTVFTDPDDPRQAFAVATIDKEDDRTRYKVWFEDEVYVYLTDKYGVEKTKIWTAGIGECGQYGSGASAEGHSRGEQLWLHPVRVPPLSSSRSTILDAWTRHVPP